MNEQALALVVANIDVKEENCQHSRAKKKSLAQVSIYILGRVGGKHLLCLLARTRILVLNHSILRIYVHLFSGTNLHIAFNEFD